MSHETDFFERCLKGCRTVEFFYRPNLPAKTDDTDIIFNPHNGQGNGHQSDTVSGKQTPALFLPPGLRPDKLAQFESYLKENRLIAPNAQLQEHHWSRDWAANGLSAGLPKIPEHYYEITTEQLEKCRNLSIPEHLHWGTLRNERMRQISDRRRS